MDFGKLSSNEKLAVYGAVATIIGSIFGGGFFWLALLAAIGMLLVVFLPQMSPATNLPGTKGSLMLLCGGVAAIAAILGLLLLLPLLAFYFSFSPLSGILSLVGLIGALVMGWAGWMEFQSSGGKFQVGAAGSAAPPPPPPTIPPPPPAGAPPAPRSEDDDRPA